MVIRGKPFGWPSAILKGFLRLRSSDYVLKEETVITTGIIKLEILAGAKAEKECRQLKSPFDGWV